MSMNWPGTEDVHKLIREFPESPENHLGARFLPLNTTDYTDTESITWDILGPSVGMTQPHLLNMPAKPVAAQVLKTKTSPTAYWKDKAVIDEKDMLRVAQAGENRRQLMRERLAALRTEQLNTRLDARLEWLRWQCLLGSVTVNENGISFTLDYEIPNANKLTVGSGVGVAWDSFATADPVKDLRDASRLLRGSGAESITAVMNAKTSDLLSENENIIDRVRGSSSVLNIGRQNISMILSPMVGTINEFVTYDKGYRNDSSVWAPFVPDNKVILIGEAPGEMLGEFASTPTTHNGGMDPMPGKFAFTKDESENGDPPHVDIIGGIYGMPVLMRPYWVVTLTVTS